MRPRWSWEMRLAFAVMCISFLALFLVAASDG